MTKTVLNFTLLFVVLILAQALIFNHLVLFGCAIPMVFILLIVRLPMSMSVSWTLTVAFLLGITTDIFSDTPGLNALACTVTAFMRRSIFHIYAPREDDIMSVRPTPRTMGTPAYAKYLLSFTLVYCALVFIIEAFGFFHPWIMLKRTIASTIYTFLLLYAFSAIPVRRNSPLS
ncbi:MAG: rod shape-determining protein MreD [Muribaculaceae bacterium]|nr:rod shape-determining protein MreD [Muribaculaceae bacterium]